MVGVRSVEVEAKWRVHWHVACAAVSFAVHRSLDAGERVRVVVPVWGGR